MRIYRYYALRLVVVIVVILHNIYVPIIYLQD